MARVQRVSTLAEEAGLDVDETLVALWDAGLDRFEDGNTAFRRAEWPHARAAVGLAGGQELTSRDYWRQSLQLDAAEFEGVLKELDIPSNPRARKLPRGAVKKLRGYAKRLGRLIQAPRVVADSPPTPSAPAPRFVWRTLGRHARSSTLTADEVMQVHEQLAADFRADDDPIEPPGVRSADLLASATFRPETGIERELKYPTAEMVAAALCHAIVHDHPFHNGNKRTALVAMLVQLDRSNLTLTCTDADLFRFILRVAQHRIVSSGTDLADREVASMAEWICENERDIDRSERTLQWRKLRRLLHDFGCQSAAATGVGHRLNIWKEINEGRGFFGRPKRRILKTQVHWAGDGTDAPRGTIKKLRADLELDDDHGVDSVAFYQARPDEVAHGFIIKYRKALRRLAQL